LGQNRYKGPSQRGFLSSTTQSSSVHSTSNHSHHHPQLLTTTFHQSQRCLTPPSTSPLPSLPPPMSRPRGNPPQSTTPTWMGTALSGTMHILSTGVTSLKVVHLLSCFVVLLKGDGQEAFIRPIQWRWRSERRPARRGLVSPRFWTSSSLMTLGARGCLPSRQIESFLRVFKQFVHNKPRG
jgi:hypothetical protein